MLGTGFVLMLINSSSKPISVPNVLRDLMDDLVYRENAFEVIDQYEVCIKAIFCISNKILHLRAKRKRYTKFNTNYGNKPKNYKRCCQSMILVNQRKTYFDFNVMIKASTKAFYCLLLLTGIASMTLLVEAQDRFVQASMVNQTIQSNSISSLAGECKDWIIWR
jgi:hypothetical protein